MTSGATSMGRVRWLVAELVALGILYAAWFGARGSWVAVAVFALPPLVLAWRTAIRRGLGRAPFWASVLSLAWFSHGIMVAWSRPGEAAFALGAVVLSLAVLFAASLPALRARFGGRKQGPGGL